MLVKSGDGTFAAKYNILAQLHKDAANMKLLDTSYSGRLTMAFDGAALKVGVVKIASPKIQFSK